MEPCFWDIEMPCVISEAAINSSIREPKHPNRDGMADGILDVVLHQIAPEKVQNQQKIALCKVQVYVKTSLFGVQHWGCASGLIISPARACT